MPGHFRHGRAAPAVTVAVGEQRLSWRRTSPIVEAVGCGELGAAWYGDPCRECGHDWSGSPQRALELVSGIPDRYADLLAEARVHWLVPLPAALWSLRGAVPA